MRGQSQKRLIALTYTLLIAFCLNIPDLPRSSLAHGAEDITRLAQRGGDKTHDRIEPKYENGKYVGDKFYKDGKLVKETTNEYHENSDKLKSETVTEYHPDSGGQYKSKEEETTYRPDGSKSSNTVTEYGGVNNPQKRRTKAYLSDGGIFETATTYEEGGSSIDAERRIKTEDRTQTDKYRRPVVIEHIEFTDPLEGPKGIKSGYRQVFEYPDKDATEPSKKKDEHYEPGKDGKGEWKPGLLPPPKSASKPSKAAPAPAKTPQPKPSPKKTLKSETTMRTIGIVRPANSRPGERAVVSVVLDPARYESIPGLKVIKKEIALPLETTATGSLTGIVVDTGDGRTQRADGPIQISIPRDASLISVSLRREEDSTLLARVDTPIETTPVLVSDEGLDPSESPALEPGEEKVRRSREEAYRRTLRRATESGQAVDEARRARVSEDDLAKLRRQDQKNKDEAEAAAQSVPPERRRAIQKEEAEAYKRAAEEARKKAQEERNKIGPDRQKEKDGALIDTLRREAKARADEAERKARALDEEAKKNEERANALDMEVGKTKAGSPNSYRIPPLGRDVGVHIINGPFKGDAIEDNIMVDGRPDSAVVVAKSTRSLFYRLKEGTSAGMHRITVREESGEIDLPLCVLNLALSADQLNLLRGQSTRLRAVISGPEQLPPSAWKNASVPSELVDVPSIQNLAPGFRVPVPGESGRILFVLENKSRDTVTIGEEVVVLSLNEQDFSNGPYRYEGGITARKSGSFRIDGTVVAFLTPVAGGMRETPADEVEGETDSPNPSVEAVPQTEAEKCVWVRYNLGKDTNVTSVKSDKPTVVEVRLANLSGSGGFEYHCLSNRGTALITYKYTDVNGANQEGKLRVFCK